MKQTKLVTLSLIVSMCIWGVNGQTTCDDLGFENMAANADEVDVNGWTLLYGENDVAGPFTIENPTNATTNCGFLGHNSCGGGVKVYNADYEHHDIKNATPNGDDLENPPPLPNLSGTNTRCIRLGQNTTAFSEAAGMRATFTVTSPYIAYHYILRFEASGHTPDNRGFSTLKITDASGTVHPCGSYEIYEDGPEEEWEYTTNGNEGWIMSEWETKIVDLSGYMGQQMTIEVWVADCQEGAHAGWGYFDFECLNTATPDCSITGGCTPPNLAVQPLSSCTSVDLVDGVTDDGGGTITYYASQTDATSGSNAISGVGISTSGSYFVRNEDPTDATCFTTAEIVVDIAPVSISVIAIDPTTCGGSDGELQITVPNANTAYDVSLDGGSSNPYTSDGNGVIVISGYSGGDAVSSIDVSESVGSCAGSDNTGWSFNSPGGPTITLNNTSITACGSGTATLDATTSSGALSWTASDGSTVSNGDAVSPASGTVTYTVTADDGGCIATESFTITITTGPSLTVSAQDPTTCGATDGEIQLVIAPAGTYDVDIDGTNNTGIVSDGITPIIFGGYGSVTISSISVSDPVNGCNASDNSGWTLTAPGAPTANAGPDVTICSGSHTLQAVNPSPTATTVEWTGGLADGSIVTPNVTTTYTLSITENGCTATDDMTVFVNGANTTPVITGGTTFCTGDTVVLATGDSQTQWYADPTLTTLLGTGDTYSVPSSIPGTVTVYAINGDPNAPCPGTPTSHTFNVLQGGFLDVPDTLRLCEGAPFLITASASDSVDWGNGLRSFEYTSVAQNDTVLFPTVTASCGTITQPVVIQVYPNPTIDAGPDQAAVRGELVEVSGSGAVAYEWELINNTAGVDYLNCPTCQSTEGYILFTSLYVLTGWNEYGCVNTDTILITIDGMINAYVPNVFSPNGDGENDVFRVEGPDFHNFSMMIFNRWGELIFETDNNNEGWDGTWRNKTAGTGVYTYVIEGRAVSGEDVTFGGNVTLVR